MAVVMDDLDIETATPAVLRAFHARVDSDELLGPIFNAAAHDWDEHLDRTDDFWSSVMLSTGRYKSNSVAKHLPLAPQIGQACFTRLQRQVNFCGSCRRGIPDTRRRGMPRVCD